MPRTSSLDPSILFAALIGLEANAKRLDQQIAQVRSLMGRRRPGRSVAGVPRRRLSPEGRARIVAAAKKRWAEQNSKAAKKAAAPARKPAKKPAVKKTAVAAKAKPARATKPPVKKATAVTTAEQPAQSSVAQTA